MEGFQSLLYFFLHRQSTSADLKSVQTVWAQLLGQLTEAQRNPGGKTRHRTRAGLCVKGKVRGDRS